jgi:hypothetical protein
MNTSSLLNPDQPLTRHDDRARRNLRRLPQIEYHFQAKAAGGGAARNQPKTVGSAELRAFWQISSNYLGEEMHRSYLIEMLVFALVSGLAAWSLISLLIILADTARG